MPDKMTAIYSEAKAFNKGRLQGMLTTASGCGGRSEMVCRGAFLTIVNKWLYQCTHMQTIVVDERLMSANVLTSTIVRKGCVEVAMC